jgi:hypothetical protein
MKKYIERIKALVSSKKDTRNSRVEEFEGI